MFILPATSCSIAAPHHRWGSKFIWAFCKKVDYHPLLISAESHISPVFTQESSPTPTCLVVPDLPYHSDQNTRLTFRGHLRVPSSSVFLWRGSYCSCVCAVISFPSRRSPHRCRRARLLLPVDCVRVCSYTA